MGKKQLVVLSWEAGAGEMKWVTWESRALGTQGEKVLHL